MDFRWFEMPNPEDIEICCSKAMVFRCNICASSAELTNWWKVLIFVLKWPQWCLWCRYIPRFWKKTFLFSEFSFFSLPLVDLLALRGHFIRNRILQSVFRCSICASSAELTNWWKVLIFILKWPQCCLWCRYIPRFGMKISSFLEFLFFPWFWSKTDWSMRLRLKWP